MASSLSEIVQAIQKQTGEGYKPLLIQAMEIVHLHLKMGLHPSEYYSYGLASRSVSKQQLNTYVSTKWYWRTHVPKLASSTWTPILHNKWLFHLYFRHRDVALPRTLGFFDALSGVTTDDAPLRNMCELASAIRASGLKTLVCKPVGGIGGADVMVFDEIDLSGSMICRTKSGRSSTLEKISQNMLSNEDAKGFLIQERVSDHPFFSAINPFTASSIRVVTLRAMNGDIHTPLSSVRFGRKGGTVDNLSQGGISAHVDPGTGTIGRGICRPQYLRKFVEVHPDTEVQFTGQVIPLWQEIRELCIRAAQSTPCIHAVGWDILLSPSGPVLLEGNHDWELSVHQARNKGYLTPKVSNILRCHGLLTDAQLK